MRNFVLIITLSFFSSISHAQWENIYEIENNNFYTADILPDGKLILGAERADIYYQKDNGEFEIIDLQPYGFLSDIDFEDENVGYIGGGCYFTFDECLPNTIYKTIDGGLTWTLQDSYGTTGVINSIEVVGEQQIFALSDYEDLLYSTDGGQSWVTREINPTDEIGRHEKLLFLDSNIGFVIGRGYSSGIGSYSILYKTIDGAQTWQPIYQPSQTISDIHDYFFINESIGFIGHSNGELAKTTNGGQTWETFNYTNNSNEQATKIIFVTNKTGYLVSRNSTLNKSYIYKTSDGGETWIVDLELDDAGINDLVFEDSENGYAIVNFRKIYKRSGTVISSNSFAEINVNPNPVQDNLRLYIDELPIGNYQLTIYNTIGQAMINTNQIYSSIDVEKLMNGVYFIEIRDEQSNLKAKGKFLKSN